MGKKQWCQWIGGPHALEMSGAGILENGGRVVK